MMKTEDMKEMVETIIEAVDYDMYKEIFLYEDTEEGFKEMLYSIAKTYLQNSGIVIE